MTRSTLKPLRKFVLLAVVGLLVSGCPALIFFEEDIDALFFGRQESARVAQEAARVAWAARVARVAQEAQEAARVAQEARESASTYLRGLFFAARVAQFEALELQVDRIYCYSPRLGFYVSRGQTCGQNQQISRAQYDAKSTSAPSQATTPP